MATVPRKDALTASTGSLFGRLFRSRETGIVVALVLMVVLLSIAAPEFRSPDNLLNDARNFSYVGIVVIGQAMVMITGGIDLSVGSVWGVSAVTTASLMAAGWSTIPACAVGLLVSAGFGLFIQGLGARCFAHAVIDRCLSAGVQRAGGDRRDCDDGSQCLAGGP